MSHRVERVEGGVEVAHGRVEVDRLHRVAGQEVDDVEVLAQAEQVLVVGPVADPAAAVHVGDVGRAGDRTERHGRSADGQAVVGVPGVEAERRGRGGDPLEHHVRVEPHPRPVAVDVGPRLGQQAAGLRVQEVHADVAQDPQRREVDDLELVLRHDLGGSHPQRRLGPRALLGDQAAPSALAASPTPPAAPSGVAPALATQLAAVLRAGGSLGPGLGGGFGHGGPSSPLLSGPASVPVGPSRRQLPEHSSRE